ECLPPHLPVTVPTEVDEPGVELGQGTGRNDLHQIGDDPRLLFRPEAMKDGLQRSFVGVHPPAPEPETPAVTLGGSKDFLDGGRRHPLLVGTVSLLHSFLLLVLPPVLPIPADRLIP